MALSVLMLFSWHSHLGIDPTSPNTATIFPLASEGHRPLESLFFFFLVQIFHRICSHYEEVLLKRYHHLELCGRFLLMTWCHHWRCEDKALELGTSAACFTWPNNLQNPPQNVKGLLKQISLHHTCERQIIPTHVAHTHEYKMTILQSAVRDKRCLWDLQIIRE